MNDLRLGKGSRFLLSGDIFFVIMNHLDAQVAAAGQTEEEDEPFQVEQTDSHFFSSFLYFPQDEFDRDWGDLVNTKAGERTEQANELNPIFELT